MPTPFSPTPHYAPINAGEFRWSMGLAPLDLDDWIQVDSYSPGDLAEKERDIDVKKAMIGRSIFWYEQAVSVLTGAARAELETRIKEAKARRRSRGPQPRR